MRAPPAPSLAARAGSADNGPAPKPGRAQQTNSAAEAAPKRPSGSGGGAQQEQGGTSDEQAAKRRKGLSAQSAGLADANVHQAVQAVQVWPPCTSLMLSHLTHTKALGALSRPWESQVDCDMAA